MVQWDGPRNKQQTALLRQLLLIKSCCNTLTKQTYQQYIRQYIRKVKLQISKRGFHLLKLIDSLLSHSHYLKLSECISLAILELEP